jgi:hypothetical protein
MGIKTTTYTNPKPKTAERMNFCRRGRLIVHTTGMGRRKMRKSVTVSCVFVSPNYYPLWVQVAN